MRSRCRLGIAGAACFAGLAVALLCVVVLTCDAQETPRNPAAGEITAATTPQLPVSTGTAAPAGESVATAGAPRAPAAVPHSEFPMNPDAKWACDQQTVVAKPVWRGQERLSFTFLIRNEGTADLQIRAKGG